MINSARNTPIRVNKGKWFVKYLSNQFPPRDNPTKRIIH
jgi:hypothetical protein